MTDRRTVRTWAEVDLDALAHNCRLLRELAPDAGFLGLVKANAYGHGSVPVGRKLQELGVEMLAVACLDEAVELRRGGITIPILCLGQTPPELASELLEYNVTQTVGDLETGKALSAAAEAAGKTLKIHVKVDTGMGRLGFLWGDPPTAGAARDIIVLSALPGLEVEGIFTHFANADGSGTYTELQRSRFRDALQVLEDCGIRFKICHCAASAAVLNYPETHLNMIRPGIVLYGCMPDPSVKNPGLRAVMTVKSRVAAVRDLPAGSCISYGCTAELKRDSRVAVLPIGYGDGLPRALSNKLEVRIGDKLCPVVGRVCMDMCMADVTDLPGVRPGDVAEVYGPGLTDRAAALAGTIPYELLCQLTARVPRVYLEGGAVIF
ncbi:MAG: alanine racemase [Lawsonibacter sp.]|nr:alanine racemase [Lawsonibacter sp.]